MWITVQSTWPVSVLLHELLCFTILTVHHWFIGELVDYCSLFWWCFTNIQKLPLAMVDYNLYPERISFGGEGCFTYLRLPSLGTSALNIILIIRITIPLVKQPRLTGKALVGQNKIRTPAITMNTLSHYHYFFLLYLVLFYLSFLRGF